MVVMETARMRPVSASLDALEVFMVPASWRTCLRGTGGRLSPVSTDRWTRTNSPSVAPPGNDERSTGHRIVDHDARETEHLLDELGCDDLGRFALGDDAPVFHSDEMAGVTRGVVEVVKHGHDRGARPVEVREEVEQVDLVRDVE